MEALMHRLIEWSVYRRGLVLALTAGFSIFCLWSISRLNFDAFPDITNTQVQVVTSSPGLSSVEVEQLITLPIERALGGVPGVLEQRSLSRAGVSSITVVFEDGSDLWRCRQLVKERLDSARAEIPADVGEPELGPPSTGLGEAYQFTVSSDRHSMPELYRIFERDIAPRFRSVSGVVEVNAWGGGSPQLEVYADPVRMLAAQVTWRDLRESLERSIARVSGGSLRSGVEMISVRAESELITPNMIASLPIVDGVRVGDVATVLEGGALTVGLGSDRGRGEALFVMVQLLSGVDALSVVKELKNRHIEVDRSLPAGVKLEVIYDRSELINQALSTVSHSLFEGGGLVIFVLLLLLGDLRAGLLVSSIIPLSMLGALAGLAWSGVSGNLMSLGAIDFGLVVDGAIVVAESVIAIQVGREVYGGEGLRSAVLNKSKEVAGPVALSILILCLVYTPILSLWGTEGKLFRPMALTVLFALSVAFILSFTYIPALSTWLIKPKGDHRTAIMKVLSRAYEPILSTLLPRPGLALILILSLMVLSAAVSTQLGVTFVPRLEEGDLVIQSTRLPSISPEQALRDATRLERVLMTFPEVLKVSSRIGSPAVATDPMGLEQADVFIKLKPRDQWVSAESTEGLSQAFSEAVERAGLSGQIGFSQPIEMRFNEMLEGITADVGIKVFGPELSTLRELGAEIAGILDELEGAADIKRPDQEGITSQTISLEPGILSLFDLSAVDLASQVSGLQRGVEVGRVRRGLFQDAIVLKFTNRDAFELKDHPVILGNGAVAPLKDLAQLKSEQVPVTIEREIGSRRVIVQANVRGRDLGAFVREAKVKVGELKLPPGYWIEWSGQYTQLEEASKRMSILIPSVLLLILALLFIAFRSLKLTGLIALNLPIAMSGGLITLWLTRTPLSLSAIVGCVALFGVAVMNGVVLLSRTQRLHEQLGKGRALEAAYQSAHERLRPVFTTALVAGLGFIPMALASGVGAEVQRPLALVVIGGLVTSTTLSLCILPTLYVWAYRSETTENLTIQH